MNTFSPQSPQLPDNKPLAEYIFRNLPRDWRNQLPVLTVLSYQAMSCLLSHSVPSTRRKQKLYFLRWRMGARSELWTVCPGKPYPLVKNLTVFFEHMFYVSILFTIKSLLQYQENCNAVTLQICKSVSIHSQASLMWGEVLDAETLLITFTSISNPQVTKSNYFLVCYSTSRK